MEQVINIFKMGTFSLKTSKPKIDFQSCTGYSFIITLAKLDIFYETAGTSIIL